MIVFITAVLVAAAIQSFCKLALLPRKWELVGAVLLMPLPLLFGSRISQASMSTFNTTISSAATLENWCALVVIQELFTLVAGFSLLTDFESETKVATWKYLVFLPSLLLPAGALYLQMFLFNALPDLSFTAITGWLTAGLPLALVLTAELMRLFKHDREERILAVLHLEYFLVFAAIFLPVAAAARLAETAPGPFPVAALLTFAGFAAVVGASAFGFRIHMRYKRKKKNV
jgi:hypothetical protein